MRALRRLAFAFALVVGAPGARADSDFIPVPIPPEQPPAPAPDRAAEIERATREARERLEEGRVEQGGTPADVEAQRAREERTDEAREIQQKVDRARAGGAPPSDAERVRGDIDRAREKLERERRIDALEPRRR